MYNDIFLLSGHSVYHLFEPVRSLLSVLLRCDASTVEHAQLHNPFAR